MGGIDLATLGADDLLIRGARLSEGSSDGAKPLYREGERGFSDGRLLEASRRERRSEAPELLARYLRRIARDRLLTPRRGSSSAKKLG
jgi:hypothetical protein